MYTTSISFRPRYVQLFQVTNGNDTLSNRATGKDIFVITRSDHFSKAIAIPGKKEVSHKSNLILSHWESSKLMPECQNDEILGGRGWTRVDEGAENKDRIKSGQSLDWH